MNPERYKLTAILPPISATRRHMLLAPAAAALLGACAPGGSPPLSVQAAPARQHLRLIGEARIPHNLQFQGTTVGGLSGIDHDAASGNYFLLSDDGSARNPARFYTARIPLDASQLGQPEIIGMTTLRQADGSAYGSGPLGEKLLDPEAIRWRAASQSLFWTSEGNAIAGLAPSLSESRLDGTLIRKFVLPPMFDFGLTSGPRLNLTFEGMTLTPDGKSAWLSMEAAMRQDGPVPAVGVPGGPCRLTQVDLASGRVLRQIAYIPDAISRPPIPATAHADNGISEILMLDANRMLVLERSYVAGYGTDVGNTLRLYLVDTRDGSDTLGVAALQTGNYRPAGKTLLADFSAFVGPGAGKRLDRLDNTEGMSWGPVLSNGNRSLLFISDNNFSSRQITQLLAFEFTG